MAKRCSLASALLLVFVACSVEAPTPGAGTPPIPRGDPRLVGSWEGYPSWDLSGDPIFKLVLHEDSTFVRSYLDEEGSTGTWEEGSTGTWWATIDSLWLLREGNTYRYEISGKTLTLYSDGREPWVTTSDAATVALVGTQWADRWDATLFLDEDGTYWYWGGGLGWVAQGLWFLEGDALTLRGITRQSYTIRETEEELVMTWKFIVSYGSATQHWRRPKDDRE